MKKTPLNFDWTYKVGFESKDLNGFEGALIQIPHNNIDIPKHYFSEHIYQFVSTYQKKIQIAKTQGQRYFLYFEGVMSKADVYMNQIHLVHHVGGYTDFKVELTDYITGDDIITVVVDSIEHKDHPPFGHVVDYLTYGGIYREVTLIETSNLTFDYVHVFTTLNELTFKIYPNTLDDHIHDVTCLVFDDQKEVLKLETKAQCHLPFELSHSHNLTPWHINHPKLYTVKIYVDETFMYEQRFGIREVRVDQDGFYLNNEHIFLRGLNRHQSFAYKGYAMPKRAQEMDAEILKYELGVNIVRSSHYPPSTHFLNRCDEIGLMVFTELPGWQHVGDTSWKAHALNDLKSMVYKDQHHPSIVIIGTRINESQDDHDFYTQTRDLVKSIDPSRPTGGVRFFGHSELLEDIYTLNDFIHRGNNPGVSKKKSMTKKHHPYLITEYNGHMFPTKSFDDETKRIEHTKRHYQVLNDAYRTKGLMGAIGWCMNDYHTHRDFGSNDHICHHGVLDIHRNHKYAASAYASQREKPYMNVLSMMHIGELPNGELKSVMVSTNMDYVRVYKNDTLIGTYDRKTTPYPDMPYPPIVIEDFIGRQIHDQENLSEKDATRIKNILLKTLKKGLKMSLWTKIQMGYVLLKNKLSYQDAVRFYTTYIGGWGEKSKVYRFEGIKDGQVLIEKTKGHNDTYDLDIKVSNHILETKDTYDVAKITVELKNQLGERAFYSSDIIEIEVDDHISLIGPSKISLQGGIQSFWVTGLKEGQSKLMIKSDTYENHAIDFEVK